jgi:Mn2+/Fe2+ NRAMP family transporter
MGYAAIALAVLGTAIGMTFRLRFLLGVVILVLVITLIVASSRHYGLLDSMLVVLAAQALLQAGYFAGLVGRVFFSRVQSNLTGLSAPEAKRLQQRDS